MIEYVVGSLLTCVVVLLIYVNVSLDSICNKLDRLENLLERKNDV